MWFQRTQQPVFTRPKSHGRIAAISVVLWLLLIPSVLLITWGGDVSGSVCTKNNETVKYNSAITGTSFAMAAVILAMAILTSCYSASHGMLSLLHAERAGKPRRIRVIRADDCSSPAGSGPRSGRRVATTLNKLHHYDEKNVFFGTNLKRNQNDIRGL